ncbi:MAG: UDP-N-acetylmuramoyl-L-alanyl-D-glutamate--2,6-diaminopimelate ligase, partial [Bacillota bacterium]|nr:UDP-N-acetylmuramoyl-L-alanyl-D-glutamate--2,6-diaminopimelate ligase [Bacillota bacterium]
MEKKLRELIAATPVLTLEGLEPAADVTVNQIAYDSRRVEPGGLFVAIRGFRQDGHLYLPEALARGARAVVVDRPEVSVPP